MVGLNEKSVKNASKEILDNILGIQNIDLDEKERKSLLKLIEMTIIQTIKADHIEKPVVVHKSKGLKSIIARIFSHESEESNIVNEDYYKPNYKSIKLASKTILDYTIKFINIKTDQKKKESFLKIIMMVLCKTIEFGTNSKNDYRNYGITGVSLCTKSELRYDDESEEQL